MRSPAKATMLRDGTKQARPKSKRDEAAANKLTNNNQPKIKPAAPGGNKGQAASRRKPRNAPTEPSVPAVAATSGLRITKKSQLIGLLSTPAGADIAALSVALGWKSHTTRAALTGLRKAGFRIEAVKLEGKGAVSTYRIITINDAPDITNGAQ